MSCADRCIGDIWIEMLTTGVVSRVHPVGMTGNSKAKNVLINMG